mmetsp:Transcript_16129/g.19704  ORF Transcript_16129/g.19704 Transcript_16129/m.19704 type:complete len:396 (-) Transcript_16129:830-2017(-)
MKLKNVRGDSLHKRKGKISIQRFTIVLTGLLISVSLLYCNIFFHIMAKKQGSENENELTSITSIGAGTIISKSTSKISKSSSNKLQSSRVGKGAVMVIAAAPFNYIRAYALWSQLECFTNNIQKVVITASDWSKPVLEPFIEEARNTIPHFKDGTVTVDVRYFTNDRYDIGLWCDSLKDNQAIKRSLLDKYDDFTLINDSVMAVEQSSEMIDTLRDKNLNVVSLTYSLLEGYWIEANYRAFSSDGIHPLLNHICVPNDCDKKKAKWKRHRCNVDNFEVPIAGLYPRSSVWGLYHGDAGEYFQNKPMQMSEMWHSNYPYWAEVLRKEHNVPAVKISNRWFYEWLIKKNKPDHDRCIHHLTTSTKASSLALDFDHLMENADSVNQIEFTKYKKETNK